MLSKNDIQLIRSLEIKKYRRLHHLFVAEGKKVVDELISSKVLIHKLFSTKDYISDYKGSHLISLKELKKISFLETSNSVLGIFKIASPKPLPKDGLVLALDGLQNPGNMGTIIRLCLWYGVRDIVCSRDTVDCYNPKVVQASTGAICKVNIHYTDLNDYIKKSKMPVFKMDLKGSEIQKVNFPKNLIIIMGNESKGISKETCPHAVPVTIPRYKDSKQPESLNVGTATAIALYQIRNTTG